MRSALRVALADLALIGRFRIMQLAVIGVALVPAIYALIYLSSVWDPNAKTSALPVALVNLDVGVRYRQQETNVGQELVEELERGHLFGWQRMKDAESARNDVARGKLAFAVIIPEDFSAQAVPGAVAGGGKIRVILSEGNNYSSAGFARRFAVDLGHQVNETLNEKRWALVLSSADGSAQSLVRLRSGMAHLQEGALALKASQSRYNAAAAQVAGGFSQIAGGVRVLESRFPAEADLKALRSGSLQLAQGQQDLTQGLDTLHAGSKQLDDGIRRFREQAADIPLLGERLGEGAAPLQTGAGQLAEGIDKARSASQQLAQGATQLDAGIARLTDGVVSLEKGVQAIAIRLPADGQLETFTASGKLLADGSQRLIDGIALVEAALPASVDSPGGSARGLAESVEPLLDVLAPVPNNGSAFAPNMVAVALWIGAVMAAYLFNMNRVPASLAQAPRIALVAGKFLVPALLTLVQTVLVYLMLVHGLGVQAPSALNLVLTMALASWVFLAMLFALLRVFGEASKLLAVLLLTLQLAAGGGVIPVELSGGLFQAVHDWLPFTWVVKAFRASLFDAYDHGWAQAWGTVAAAGGLSLLLATLIGRWQVVPDDDYRPGIQT
ncbi:MAG: YhgE/Pip domain-containing protein [Burkholderiaceae bacterium]|nr:YhgE/Pip domain-containing protein [Burkholderiaceae bacterium]